MVALTARLNALVDELQGGRRRTMAELAERLGVSERTVRRDIERLQLAGVPVEVSLGRLGGVSLPPGSLLTALRFTDDEALALGFGLVLVRRLAGPELSHAADGAARRLSGVLGDAVRQRIEALRASVAAAPLGPNARTATPPDVESRIVLDLAEAVREKRCVHLEYRSFGGDFTSRWVEPYGMVNFEGKWYVAGYCRLRNDMRVFRIDRIRSARPGGPPFEAPVGFDGLRVVTESIASAPFPDTVPCVLSLDCELATATRLLPAGMVSLVSEGDRVRATMQENLDDLEALALRVLRLPVGFEVLGPPSFREAFARVAARAAGVAQEGRAEGFRRR